MENFVADGIFIDAPAGEIISTLLDPEGIRVWMDAEEAAVEPRRGGSFRARRRDGSTVTGTVVGLEPGRLVEIGDYYWERQGLRRGPMKLRFLLEARHGGHWITVRQDHLDSGEDWKKFARATRKELVRATVTLKRHIEQI